MARYSAPGVEYRLTTNRKLIKEWPITHELPVVYESWDPSATERHTRMRPAKSLSSPVEILLWEKQIENYVS